MSFTFSLYRSDLVADLKKLIAQELMNLPKGTHSELNSRGEATATDLSKIPLFYTVAF